MADETYTKLFSSITRSSIWLEDDQTLRVWVTMLALANRHGYVGASAGGLAATARVPVEKVRAALDKFMSPDPDSRSPEYEGRRVEVADRGWNILNYDRFRDMRDEEMRKTVDRDRKREQRAAKEKAKSSPSHGVEDSSKTVEDKSGNVPKNPPSRGIGSAEAKENLGEAAPKVARPKPWKIFPKDFEPDDSHRKLAADLGVNLDRALAEIRDHEFKDAKTDAGRALSRWIRNSPRFTGQQPPAARADDTGGYGKSSEWV